MRILLIDDEPTVIEGLERIFTMSGYECFSFQSARDALERYAGIGHDVVITDFMMPETNGIEVLKAIRAMDPEARVIILTGYADIESAIAAVNNGAYAFFRKPLDIRDFIRTLKKIEQEIEEKSRKERDLLRLREEYYRIQEAVASLQQTVNELNNKRQVSVR